jgi:hypothetical protein
MRAKATYPKTSWEISGGPSSRIRSAATIVAASARIGNARAPTSTSP